jgi:hypothetical protein
MLQSRRGFLIGAGSLLTAAFAKDARSFVRRNSRPLLASPAQIVQTLHFYPSAELASVGEVAQPGWFGCADDQGCLLTLGRWELEPPPAPTWREFLVGEGFALETEADAEYVYSIHGIEPDEYDKRVWDWYWFDRWMLEDGPFAKAFRLLRGIDVGPDVNSALALQLQFHQGAHPGDNSCWVNATDKLSLSLLQARLIDLNIAIKIVAGE